MLQKLQALTQKGKRTSVVAVMLVAMGVTFGLSIAPRVTADSYDRQIQALQNENSNKQDALSALKVQASSYQDAIAQLQAQINGVQEQINANTAKQNELQAKINENQDELARQRGVLGENIRVMYLEGQISTLEMLATSKNLSDYVDKEEYRTAVRSKIQETLKTIARLQAELKGQKLQVEQLLAEQRGQQQQLNYSRSEQAKLLTYNKSQQTAYTNEMKANEAKIADLKEKQAIENARLFGGTGGTVGGGGYPWGYAACIHTGKVEGRCSNYDWAVNGNIWNYQHKPGGYGYRNCTDWVAWKLKAPSGLGNAKQWDDRAAAMGYTVSSTPKRGVAAVSNSGDYGHVMLVEAVESDGTIIISDYNRAGTGLYSTASLERVGEGRYRNASTGGVSQLVFVYL